MANESEIFDQLKDMAASVLQVASISSTDDIDTPLLGHIAELDSMAVVTLLTTIEEQYGVTIDDDEISADVFENWRSLVRFVAGKLES